MTQSIGSIGARVNILVRAGDDMRYSGTIAADLTGSTMTGRIRNRATGAETAITVSIGSVTSTLSSFTFVISRALTATWVAADMAKPDVLFDYIIDWLDSANTLRTVLFGEVGVVRDL